MKPIVKWPGGKRKLIPELLANMPESYGRYVEPFLGGGALFFHLEPRGAILGDSNEHLINTYRMIRSDWPLVAGLLGQCARRHSEEFYYLTREAFNLLEPFRAQKAAHFLYLNKTGFNGLYRVNKKGEFNVPFGKYKNPSFPSATDLRLASECLERSSLRCAHYADTIFLAEEGDFIYCDPPYDLPDGHKYTAAGFDRHEQANLATCLIMKGRRGVKWMVSNSDTEFIRDLYSGYNIVEVLAARSINSDGGGRGKITELLIKNY